MVCIQEYSMYNFPLYTDFKNNSFETNSAKLLHPFVANLQILFYSIHVYGLSYRRVRA